MKKLGLLFCFLIFITTPVASAQFTGSVISAEISIALSPQHPNPGESFKATLEDYSINSNGGTVAWFIDGVESVNLRGQRAITMTAPAVGKSVKVTAQLSFTNKPNIVASRTIKPLYLDVIVEPQTYTPAFYAGRALPVHGSRVNLTALIQNENGLLDPQNYSYNWQLNNKSVYGGPRTGGYQAQITVPYGKNSTVIVSIVDKSGVTVGKKLVNIPSETVDLQFYQVSTLYGLSKRAIGDTLTLVGNSSSIRAVPYNLDTRAGNLNLFTQWSIDGREGGEDLSDPFEINIRREGVGSARVNFSVRNLSELLQGDEESFKVQF